jgi:putative phosphoribosyl transferase
MRVLQSAESGVRRERMRRAFAEGSSMKFEQQRARPARLQDVRVGPHALPGTLVQPAGGAAVVLFAHGSGSSRLSPRNRYVAEVLHARGLGTLLFDLLDEREARDRANVFDIELLGQRLVAAIDWLVGGAGPVGPLGLFGASTGAAAALYAAAQRPDRVAAVVSRGGRPDLAAPWLAEVRAPVLLVVGGHDPDVLQLNRLALRGLPADARLEVVPGATHLFEEPGTLEAAAGLAADWFSRHMLTEHTA